MKKEKKIPTCAIYIHVYTFPYCEWVDLICKTGINGKGFIRVEDNILKHSTHLLITAVNNFAQVVLTFI